MSQNTVKKKTKISSILYFFHKEAYNLITQFIHGALLTLAFHPFDIFLVIPIAFSGFLWCLEKECLSHFKDSTAKDFFYLGFKHTFIFFLGHFITSLYWIANALFVDIGQYWILVPVAVIVLPAFLSLFYSVVGGFICSKFIFRYMSVYDIQTFKKRTHQKIIIAILFTTGFFFAEIVRSNLPIQFPWNLLGYASGYSISLMQMASVTGVYGLSFILYLVGTMPYTKNPLAISTITILLVVITMLGNKRLHDFSNIKPKKYKLVTLYVVQPNLQHHYHHYEKKLAALLKTTNMIDVNSLNSQKTKDSKIKLIILPEGAIPFLLNKYQNTVFDDLMSKYSSNSFLVSGIDRYDPTLKKYYNSKIVVNHNGEIVDSYDKTILTPFGEYIPGYDFLKSIINPVVSSSYGFVPGTSTRNIRLYLDNLNKASEPLVFIPMICFESIFTPLTNPRSDHNADLIVNITNDNWFGNTIGPYHHFAMARMRAIEYGLPLVRSAKTGISAIIDSHGKILQKINLENEGVIVAEMPEDKVATVYMQIVKILYGNIKG